MGLFTVLDEIEYIGDNFCETKSVLSVMRMVGYVLTLLKVFIPIIIIIWGTLKLYNVVISGTTDSLNKQIKNLVYRVIIGICIFFVPTLVDAILKNFIPEDAMNCEICVLKPFSCDPDNPSSMTNKYVSPKCSSRGDSKSNCESAPGNGCYWDSTSTDENKCKYRDNQDKCLDECSSYTVGTKEHYTCKTLCENGQSTGSDTTTTEYVSPKCSSRGESQTICESAPGNACYWDSTSTDGSKCKYTKSADKCADQCSSYTSGTPAHFHCLESCSATSTTTTTRLLIPDVTITTSKYISPECSSRGDSQSNCESAPGNGCYWDSSSTDGNKCKYRNSDDMCADKCSVYVSDPTKFFNCIRTC